MAGIHLSSRSYGQVDNALSDNKSLCPLDNGNHHGVSEKGLGSLKKLPVELLDIVLVKLDLRTLTDFRRVNRRSMQADDHIREYAQIVAHARVVIRAALSINVARYLFCEDIYKELSKAECNSCGDFGGDLYLTGRRICYFCFTRKREYLTRLQVEAKDILTFSDNEIAHKPCMRSIPGRYSSGSARCPYQTILVDDTDNKY